ncbi:MAG: 5-amino-6-(D-ribitylamino)uracil--L-tyrosine 4-hydroxyphenyl transferase CofH [Deltaproteobacteria bacterium]|nr:5-amino-6-(D-ribitylamino)uracil--L-tyrosine 4-hydroxyphenyl transferase CofH [Deltaproteobacteria bacterium]MBW2382815.1 5-amino-6-(D-ribitylamino)uracil--L-tyrosine 4-hydroxyphenyl transferase CofH [Deltaproteobacteria bacterium]
MFERMMNDVNPRVAEILDAALEGKEMSIAEAERLLGAEGADLHALLWAADQARREDRGDDVTYVVCRNVNFTNICYVGCSFCGFARHKHQPDAYVHDMDVLLGKCAEAIARGATEICIQGGIHPQKNHHDYHRVIADIKQAFPQLHLHAYSPEEIDWGHKKSGMALDDYLRWLVEAGLGSLPGTAAEILDDEIRRILAPRKLMTDRWVEIITSAHSIGLPTTSTVMYGHIESPRHVAAHLGLIRDIQKRTAGFTEFVPLGYIHERNKLYNVLGARPGSTANEDLRMVAVARLFMRPHITNIQVSWVKMGHKLGQLALQSGANDFGGTLMEESISRESGSEHGENTAPEDFRRLIREIGRIPVERSTLYKEIARFEDPALDPRSLEHEAPDAPPAAAAAI